MKRFLLPLALYCLTACNSGDANVKGVKTEAENSKTEVTAAATKAQRNKQTAMAAMEGMNKHDIEAVFSTTAPGAKDFGDGSIPPMPMDSIKAMMGSWFTAFPDYKTKTKQVVADGEWVMVWSEQSATWKGELWGQKATGKTFKLNDVDIFRFNNAGKITEHHNIQSFGSIAQQIGYKMQ